MTAVKNFCNKYNITEDQFYGRKKIMGNLYLPSVTELIPGFNPTTGGYLDLGSVKKLIPGFNPTVGGYLNLRSVTELIPGFNPTTGGNLHLRSGLKAQYTPFPVNHIFSWQNGKYIRCDGILCEVLSKKKDIYKVKVVGKNEESYLIVSGDYSAHGATLKQAKEDLVFKIASEKLRKEPITKDTLFTVKYYRLLTGACDAGVRAWMQQNNIPFEIVGNETKEKKPIKASELIPMLEKSNAYGYERIKSLLTFR